MLGLGRFPDVLVHLRSNSERVNFGIILHDVTMYTLDITSCQVVFVICCGKEKTPGASSRRFHGHAMSFQADRRIDFTILIICCQMLRIEISFSPETVTVASRDSFTEKQRPARVKELPVWSRDDTPNDKIPGSGVGS
jgi:hypothetical protein